MQENKALALENCKTVKFNLFYPIVSIILTRMMIITFFT